MPNTCCFSYCVLCIKRYSAFINFFKDFFENYVSLIICEIVIVDEFNINYMENYTYTKRIKRCLNKYGISQHINTLTHISSNGH